MPTSKRDDLLASLPGTGTVSDRLYSQQRTLYENGVSGPPLSLDDYITRNGGNKHILHGGGSMPPPAIPGWPTILTTGSQGALVDDGMTTVSSGNINQTFTNRNFTNTVACYADGTNFVNCTFNGGFDFDNVDNVSAVDCTFKKGFAITASRTVLIERCQVVNFEPADGIHINWYEPFGLSTDVTIRDCYIYNSLATGEAHSDGIQVRGSLRLTLDHNFIDMGPANPTHSSAFYLEPVPTNNEFNVFDNYFMNREGYTLYIHNPGGAAVNGVFSNNTVAAEGFGELYDFVPNNIGITAVGNVDGSGSPLNIFGP